jgi:hypothetical protein
MQPTSKTNLLVLANSSRSPPENMPLKAGQCAKISASTGKEAAPWRINQPPLTSNSKLCEVH